MSYQSFRYLLSTVDPVHIGTGGSRLGRVDNSIVREPGTHLPKIPGTSLSGAVRQYSAYRYGKVQCAGQQGHCGKSTCPICHSFGTANDKEGSGYSGVVSVGDARLLCFPVYSMQGPVWVTSPSTLLDAGAGDVDVTAANALCGSGLTGDNLNLGWLMVTNMTSPQRPFPPLTGLVSQLPAIVQNRLVIVSDKLFSQVVNSNLEVRTSVSIDPKTGAARDGALYTYEAIPRAAYLWFDLVVDDYKERFSPISQKWSAPLKENQPDNGDNTGEALGVTWNSAGDVFDAGLGWAEHLGVGGMGTRGFGRVKKVHCEVLS